MRKLFGGLAFVCVLATAWLLALHAQEAEARRRTELACGGGRQAFEDYGKPFFQAKRLEAIRVAWYFDYDTAPWKE